MKNHLNINRTPIISSHISNELLQMHVISFAVTTAGNVESIRPVQIAPFIFYHSRGCTPEMIIVMHARTSTNAWLARCHT